MKEEQRNEIVELYKKGISYEKIEKMVHVSRRTISRFIDDMVDSGELERRKLKWKNVEKPKGWEIIIPLYESGMRVEDIALKMGQNPSGVSRKIARLIKDGYLTKRPSIPRERKKRFNFNRQTEKPVITESIEPVNCRDNMKISKTCVFGVENPNPDVQKCRFSLCTDRCRSMICPPERCTCYQKIDKDHKRAVVKGE